ncbi:hypothetical protein R6Q59_007532 [Mikania micrantha]
MKIFLVFCLILNRVRSLSVMSNGKYKSVWHRAVVNRDKGRISIPTFYSPSSDAVMGPAPQLVTDDEPALYNQFAYGEYYDKVWKNGLDKSFDTFMSETNNSNDDAPN